MNIDDIDAAIAWYGSADSARYLPDGAEFRNEAGPCCECGRHHDGYEPDPISPCGHYHSEACPSAGPEPA